MEAIIVALIGAISASVVSPVVAWLIARSKRSTAQTCCMEQGMRALLWRELKHIHAEAMSNHGMTTEDRAHLEDVYNAYHGINGNGTGTRLYEDAMGTPVIE